MKQLWCLSMRKILGSVSGEMSQEIQFRAWGHFCKSLRLFLYCTFWILYFWMWWFRMDKCYLPVVLKDKYWNILWTISLIINYLQIFLFLIICSDIGSYMGLMCNECAERYMYSTVLTVYWSINIFFNIIFSDSGLWNEEIVIELESYFCLLWKT